MISALLGFLSVAMGRLFGVPRFSDIMNIVSAAMKELATIRPLQRDSGRARSFLGIRRASRAVMKYFCSATVAAI